MSSEKDLHSKADHEIAGPFGSMATANREEIKFASSKYDRVNSEGHVQLYAWSDEFTKSFTEAGFSDYAMFKPASTL